MAYSESVGTGLFEVYLAKIVAKKEFNELLSLGWTISKKFMPLNSSEVYPVRFEKKVLWKTILSSCTMYIPLPAFSIMAFT